MPLEENASPNAKWKRCGSAGVEKGVQSFATLVTPKGIPIIVVRAIAMRIEPGTFRIKSTIVITRPIIATVALALSAVKFTKPTGVPKSVLTIPAFTRPMIVIKRPIPTDTAFLSPVGIDFMIASRTPKSERRIKMIPSTRTAVSAKAAEQPIPAQTV